MTHLEYTRNNLFPRSPRVCFWSALCFALASPVLMPVVILQTFKTSSCVCFNYASSVLFSARVSSAIVCTHAGALHSMHSKHPETHATGWPAPVVCQTWQTLSSTDKHRQTRVSTVNHRQALSTTGKHGQALSTTGKHGQALSNTGKHWQELSTTGHVVLGRISLAIFFSRASWEGSHVSHETCLLGGVA